MAYQVPTKKERQVMRQHLVTPHLLTQAEVIRKLGLKEPNSFYRLFTRCTLLDQREAERKGTI